MDETLEILSPMKYPKQTSLLEDSHAQLSPSQVDVQVSLQTIQEELSSLKSAELLKQNEYRIFSLRTSKDCLITTMEGLLESSSLRWMNLGMTFNGNVLTAKILESRRIGNEFLLSQILETEPDQKYFLSESAMQRMVNRAQKHKEKGNGFQQTIYQRSTHTTIKAVELGQSSTNQLDMFEQPNGDEHTSEI